MLDYGNIQKEFFGYTKEGIPVYEYILINRNNMIMNVLNYGGIVRELWIPIKDGQFVDVVLGYDTLEEYEKNPGYLGAIVGRYANRIASGRFTVDGVQYQLALNDGGGKRSNALHGGWKGFDKKVWNATTEITPEGSKLILKYTSHDGEEGYPGNLETTVVYTLTNDNEWKIEYTARTDKPTIVNLTQHTYFNLSGKGKIYNHKIQVYAEKFTPVNENLIPTGEIKPVEGTGYDLRNEALIGEAISKLENQGINGFDINYVLSERNDKVLKHAASVFSPESKVRIEVYTTQPGLQFYTGNYLLGWWGKRGNVYDKHTGFCLETQHFPDSPNHENFPPTVLRPGEVYYHTTIFKFKVVH
ncbi:MAG: aldose epimerase family protein [Fervidobacterium sp.]|uniref:aldose epimerase family protein n=1 Tax=Fervidobacterium TaxID=2422 RepID=UPI00220ED939|nr:aldose epimerase [Fervidobacterium riparium]